MANVTLLGATGRTGGRVLRRLAADGHFVRALGRDPARLAALKRAAETRQADLTEPEGLRQALADAEVIVSCAHARFTRALLAAAPASCTRMVLLGSTRALSRKPDPAGQQVRDAIVAFGESQRPGVMLLPSMIYGAQGENNVQRIARLLRWSPVIPLPNGGRALIQPVHVDDVAHAVAAAITQEAALGPPIIVAGPRAVTYADFVRAIASASGRRVAIASVPVKVLQGLAKLTRVLPGLPAIERDEVDRLLENKAYDIKALRERLDVAPRSLEEGLRETFAR